MICTHLQQPKEYAANSITNIAIGMLRVFETVEDRKL